MEPEVVKKKFQSPDIKHYDSFSDYLRDFMALNKAHGVPMSSEFLARKLKWSNSLLKSLIGKKRKLTMARALQFADFAQLSFFQVEQLCKFAIDIPPPYDHLDEITAPALSSKESLELLASSQGELGQGSVQVPESDFRALESKLGDIVRWLDNQIAANKLNNESTKPYYLDLSLFKSGSET